MWMVVRLIVLLVLPVAIFAQGADEEARLCGLPPGSQRVRVFEDTGGVYIPSSGTLRVLMVFASFPDDETPHPYWPAHNPPLFMQEFIDSDTTIHSQSQFNLTNYFTRMSLGQFHLVGNAIWIESLHSRQEYLNGSFGRANTDLLRERGDSLIDFSLYDSWTRLADYSHVNVPDGLVDMIVMVWRFNVFEFLGEASLGYKPGFVVDGKLIEMGYPGNIQFPLGSGITCQYVYTDGPRQVMQTIVHELGHWLLGRPHPYDGTTFFGKHAYWGLLCSGNRVASCANAYERERLGWIVVPEIQPDRNTVLTDYVSSGAACKYHPANGYPSEYFYIENHQQLSPFDDVTTNPADKGIWILHQREPYLEMDNLRMRPADGNWDWENPTNTTICSSQSLPVFRRGEPKLGTGVSHRDQIPTPTSLVNWMLVYEDSVGHLNCGAFFRGEHFSDAFDTASSSVFSPYSNPSSNTWDNQPTLFSIEIIDDQEGAITIRYNSDPTAAAPARRYLGPDPGSHDALAGGLHLAWGDQWPAGQFIEPDVTWSELQRAIGHQGVWSTVYAGASTTWADASMAYDTSGTVPVIFRARVRDSQGKYSSWSKIYRTTVMSPDNVDGISSEGSDRYTLNTNYPNPFNPSTTISFFLPEVTHVRLSIFDVVGREVRRLADGLMPRGMHAITWDGTTHMGKRAASGVYLYRLRAGSFNSVKRMVFTR